jgi:hypothetical protein
MQKYNDKTNKNGMRVLFMIMQMFMLLVVFAIVYTSFVAVQYVIKEQHISNLAYFPVLLSLVLFPVLLYRYSEMFNHGKMLGAAIWTISSGSVMIILLYFYIDKLVA